MASKLEARDGDVLVVAYPEVTIPLGGNSYSAVRVAGLIYTRKMLQGEDVAKQYDVIYAFLKERATVDGRAKVQEFQDELRKIRSS